MFKPKVVVCLGATAAQALLGKQFRVSRQRGEFVSSPLAPKVLATVHPSSILRAPGDETRRVPESIAASILMRNAECLGQIAGLIQVQFRDALEIDICGRQIFNSGAERRSYDQRVVCQQAILASNFCRTEQCASICWRDVDAHQQDAV